MNDKEKLDFLLRVLRTVNPMECEEILWSFRKGDEFPSFMVNCNDLFWWATADGEDVTPENIGELEKAYADVRAAMPGKPYIGTVHAQSLFACRMRKMRPQGACYKNKPIELWSLFDACGPEREVIPGQAFGNTPKPPKPQEVLP